MCLFTVFLSLVTVFSSETVADTCFPYGATFNITNGTIHAPNVTRAQWWCPAERFYGWLGYCKSFSQPEWYEISISSSYRYVRDLKGETCDDPVYSLDRLRQDFKKMADDGAKMVRIYGPICEQAFVWDNIILAAAENKLFVCCVLSLKRRTSPLVAEFLASFGLDMKMRKLKDGDNEKIHCCKFFKNRPADMWFILSRLVQNHCIHGVFLTFTSTNYGNWRLH